MTVTSTALSAARRSAEFFTRVREVQAARRMPPLADGDRASCPQGNLWIRSHGMWVAPDRSDELCLTDATVAEWWERHPQVGNRFALVQQLTLDTLGRISAPRYYDDLFGELVDGQTLRETAARVTADESITAHLELPSGHVTFHSTRIPLADTVYLPLYT
ncbi:hypothetical protein ACFV4X_12185 [Streptomyces ardesiacus]|uniref:hypothetical protein n=1 Tax=Streptomyces ardesiacus TaxID=285564 RepID=UPI0036556938